MLENLQRFQSGFDVGEFEEYSIVGDLFIVEKKADAPHCRGEADVLGAGQVVQHNFGSGLRSHINSLRTEGTNYEKSLLSSVASLKTKSSHSFQRFYD